MFRSIKVSLTAPRPDLLHQWRNFGEDVCRALRDECEVSIEEIDASTSEFSVRRIRRRELRTIAAKIQKIAARARDPLSCLISVCEAVAEPAPDKVKVVTD